MAVRGCTVETTGEARAVVSAADVEICVTVQLRRVAYSMREGRAVCGGGSGVWARGFL